MTVDIASCDCSNRGLDDGGCGLWRPVRHDEIFPEMSEQLELIAKWNSTAPPHFDGSRLYARFERKFGDLPEGNVDHTPMGNKMFPTQTTPMPKEVKKRRKGRFSMPVSPS